MYKQINQTLILALVALLSATVSAEEIRDYYSEPGLNPFKQVEGHTEIERIDAFSGIVQLQQTDLVVPGNGGMDISIHRSYTTPQVPFGYDWFNEMGLGWTMHFGRVVLATRYFNERCVYGGPDVGITSNNPSIEFPDGGREMLFYDTRTNDYTYITKSNWKVSCLSDGTGGFLAIAPNGTKYWMNERSTVLNRETDQQESSWYTTKIQDLHGNTLDFHYTSFGIYTNVRYISQITSSDGRVVDFTYMDKSTMMPTDENTRFAVISTITSAGQTWQYQYTPQVEATYGSEIIHFVALTSVIPPDGEPWHYSYEAPLLPESNDPANVLLLDRITYPYGGIVDYDYQFVDFFQEAGFGYTLHKWVIDTKTVSGQNVVPGTWTYHYAPGTGEGIKLDVTTITQPDGTYTDHYHYGYQWAGSGNVWAVGLLAQKITYAADGTFLEKEFNDWGWREISKENYIHTNYGGNWKLDQETKASYLKSKWVSHGSTALGYQTTYSQHDIFGNPQQIDEPTNYKVDGDTDYHRTKQITYYNDEANWVIGLAKTEKIVGVNGQVTRQYNAQGKVVQEDNYGIVSSYSYTPAGDLYTSTDANGHVTTHTNYKRGVAQRTDYPVNVNYPESVYTTRQVNDTGSLASETNGRGYTKSYLWDGLGRLTSIDFPIHNDVNIIWNSNNSTLYRGNYKEVKNYNGFGQVVSVERTDLLTNETIITNTTYDASGRAVYQSYPTKLGNTEYGTQSTYDGLGRLIKETYADGSEQLTEYVDDSEVIVTDQVGKKVKYTYRFYGTPDNDRALVNIGYTRRYENFTRIERDKLNNIKALFQGGEYLDDWNYNPPQVVTKGVFRYFTYYDNHLLQSEDHPESELITYTYDAVGNMLTKSYATSGSTTYAYDAMNRLRLIDFPVQSDITLTYDDNSNIQTTSTLNASRSFFYDENDNLTDENINIDGQLYSVGYRYNENDFINNMIYPSGKVVDFAPDAFGRATKAGSYVTNIQTASNGLIAGFNYGNGLALSNTYDNRNWIDKTQVAGITDFDYDYEPHGNVKAITSTLMPEHNRSIYYDNMDRVIEVDGSWGKARYSYDLQDNIESSVVPGLEGRNNWLSYYNQRLVEVSHDGGATVSNLTYTEKGEIKTIDTGVPGGGYHQSKTFDFDDQGNIITATLTNYDAGGNPLPTKQFDFLYDTQNNRVQKTADGKTTQFIYGNNGQLLGEYLIGANTDAKEHIYLQGKKVATLNMVTGPVVRIARADDMYEGNEVTLNANVISDAAISTLNWQQIAGPVVTLAETDKETLTFTAPEVTEKILLTFKLTATDVNGNVGDSTVNVMVKNAENTVAVVNFDPVYYLSPEMTETNVTIDASSSYDPESLAFNFKWVQISGALIDLLGIDHNPSISFMTAEGDYTFELTLTNEAGLVTVHSILLSVKSYYVNEDIEPDNTPDGWEFEHFGDINLYDDFDDPDGDSIGNYQEYLSGTDPKSFTSRSYDHSVSDLFVSAGSGLNILYWSSKSTGETYNVYWSTGPLINKASANKISNTSSPYYHKNLTNGQKYYYLVEAITDQGEIYNSFIIKGAPNTKIISDLVVSDNNGYIGFHANGVSLMARSQDELEYFSRYNRNDELISSYLYGGNDIDAFNADIMHTDEKGNLLMYAIDESKSAYIQWYYFDTRTNLWSMAPTPGPDYIYGGHIVNERSDFISCQVNRFDFFVEKNQIGDADSYAFVVESPSVQNWIKKYSVFGTSQNWSSVAYRDMVCGNDGNPLYLQGGIVIKQNGSREFDVFVSSGDSVSQGLALIDYIHKPYHSLNHIIVSNDASPMIYFAFSDIDQSKKRPSYIIKLASINYNNIGTSDWSAPVQIVSTSTYTNLAGMSTNNSGDVWLITCSSSDENCFDTLSFYYKAKNQSGFVKKYDISVADGIVLKGATVEESGKLHVITNNGINAGGLKPNETKNKRISYYQMDALTPPDSEFIVASNIDWNVAFYLGENRVQKTMSGDLMVASQKSLEYVHLRAAGISDTFPSGTVVNMPVITNPSASITVNTEYQDISGSHDVDGTVVSIYLDANNDGEADNTEALDSAIVTAGEWSVNVLLNTDANNNFVIQAGDGENVSGFADVPTITHATEGGADPLIPNTTINSVSSRSKGVTYYDITLSVDKPATTYFEFASGGQILTGGTTGSGFQPYSGPIQIKMDKGSSGLFRYYSEGDDGKVEEVKEEILQ